MMDKCKNYRYDIIGETDVNNKRLYVVMVDGNAHIMEEKEIMWMYGSWHPERWNKKNNRHKYNIA